MSQAVWVSHLESVELSAREPWNWWQFRKSHFRPFRVFGVQIVLRYQSREHFGLKLWTVLWIGAFCFSTDVLESLVCHSKRGSRLWKGGSEKQLGKPVLRDSFVNFINFIMLTYPNPINFNSFGTFSVFHSSVSLLIRESRCHAARLILAACFASCYLLYWALKFSRCGSGHM